MTIEEYKTGVKPLTCLISFGNKVPLYHQIRYMGFAVLTDEAKAIAFRIPGIEDNDTFDDAFTSLIRQLEAIGSYPGPKGFDGAGKGANG